MLSYSLSLKFYHIHLYSIQLIVQYLPSLYSSHQLQPLWHHQEAKISKAIQQDAGWLLKKVHKLVLI